MSDTRRNLMKLADQITPSIRDAFIASVQDIQSEARPIRLQTAIERRDINAVIAALNSEDEFFAPLDRAMENAFYQGGVYQLASLPEKPLQNGPRLVVRFGGRTPRAEQWVRQQSSQLIRDINERQRDVVRAVVEDGIAKGKNPRSTALEIVGYMSGGKRRGGILGLTERQAIAVVRAREELSDPERLGNYLSRTRRDLSFDSLVRRAQKEGRAVSQADIAPITSRYHDRLLELRGTTIGRTESIAALNAGRREAMQQLIDRGKVTASQVRRVWDATGDARTRLDHMGMEGQERRWGAPFTAPDGSLLMGPGDSSLGAAADQVINCRCYEQIKVNWLG